MRWESVLSTSDNEVYYLYKGNDHLLTLTLNPSSNSARVECNKQKRVFFIRKEGFLNHKTVLLNEYGIKIGELGHEHSEPFINLNEEQFFYSINDSPGGELVLYKKNKDKPIVSCNSAVEFKKKKKLAKTSHPGLLMALCWYMFLPTTKEMNAELTTV